MEHLLAPGGAKPINLPYVCMEIYEECDEYEDYKEHQELEKMYGYPKDSLNSLRNFKSFFERKGWKRDSTGHLLSGDRTSDETVAFLQTWLYFGCLISVFRCVSIPVRTSDFVYVSEGGEKFLNTLRLPGFIAEWAQRESISVGPVLPHFNGPNQIRGQNIREILHWTFFCIGDFGAKAHEGPEIPDDTLSLVKTAIVALGESLSSALVTIYGYDSKEMPIWGPSPVLKHRLQDAGWCISDSPFFPESLTNSSISADYYFGGSTCPRQRDDHTGCSAVICRAYQQKVGTNSYTAKHTSSCLGCRHIPAPEKLVEAVSQGRIPIIFWDGTAIQVTIFAPPMKYVAISHVWSDGMGNDDIHNQLPSCQLSRIQQLVTQLYKERHLSSNGTYMPEENKDTQVGFWLDTLCVPVGKENSRIRKSAIRQMREVYQQADRTLVLDSFIQKLPRTADIIDKFVRLHLSTWHHRLWTLQEGQLGSTLLFQFRDGAETFYDMMHPERHLSHRDVSTICSPVRMLCATELEAFYRHFEDLTRTSDINTRMRSCAKYLRSRQTSKAEDEPICVSTILGLDPGPLLTHSIFEDRMESFYELIKHFDSRIIFNDHPRLQKNGYRWAPRSFLNQLPDLITMQEGSEVERPLVNLVPNGGGLPICFPGFELHNFGRSLGSSILVVPKTDTVPLVQQMLPWSSQTPWWKRWYKLQLHSDAMEIAWNPRLRYAVVMYSDMHPDYLPTPAIVGTIENWQHPVGMGEPLTQTDLELKLSLEKSLNTQNSRGWVPVHVVPQRITVRYVCRANVSELSEEELIYAKEELEPHLSRLIQEQLTSFTKGQFKTNSIIGQNSVFPAPQDRTSNGMYPVLATVYSRMQRWCIL